MPTNHAKSGFPQLTFMNTISVMLSRFLLVLLLTVCAVRGEEETGHPLRGVVTRVLTEKQLVMIQHEAIPGFMMAMTMAFRVEDSVWPLLTPGTHLTATLHGGRGSWRLSEVQLTDENYQPLPEAMAEPGYPVTLIPLNSPTGPDALGPTLHRGADGNVYLSWLEKQPDETTALVFAKFDSANANWGPAIQIASGSDWVASGANAPQLAVEAFGRLTAIWFAKNATTEPIDAHAAHHHDPNFQAWYAQSDDGGSTWSKAAQLSSESNFTEFVAVQPLLQGGVLAVWLDGRAKQATGAAQQLYGRVLGTDGPDLLIDNSVCDCCHTTLTGFPNGDILVAYRARREGEIRDIHTSLFQDGHWTLPRILSVDDWQINGCPVNGPQLDSQGGQVSAVWFTGAMGMPRVYATASPDAGTRFLMPERIDLGNPLGRVSTAQLRDGSRVVSWIEGSGKNEPGIYLRRISERDEVGPAVLLAATKETHAGGFPRLALIKDYDTTPAEVMLSYTRDTDSPAVETILLTLPDLSTLANRKPCVPCDEQDANATRGYPIKGRITEVLSDDQVRVKFDEIPGVMRAATLTMQIEPELQSKLSLGQELLGRIEQRGRAWWLFNVKLLGTDLR